MGMFLRRGPAPHRTRMSDLEIGQMIKLNLNGTPWEWLVVHQGLPSAIYDASCDGTWLLLKDIYEKRQWNSSSANKLESSTIHSYLNGDFLNLFDRNIKGAIKQAKIPYRSNGGRGTDLSGANGLPVNCFLLSAYETNAVADLMPNDGEALEYFVGATDSNRIAKYNGSAIPWWTRSPRKISTSAVWFINTSGHAASGGNATQIVGIRPAIILPSDMIVTADMLAA